MRSNSPEHAPVPPRCELHNLYLSPEEVEAGGCFKCREENERDNRAAQPAPYLAGDPDPVPAAETVVPGEEPKGPMHDRLQRLIDLPNIDAPAAFEILDVCIDLAEFLMKKNKAYGDSALKPVRILSRADPAEQIRIRMDDKLSRLVRGEAGGEDAMQDLVGYWVLMRVAERRKGQSGGPP